MKKNFIRLTCLVMVAVLGIGAAFATDGSTTGSWATGGDFTNGGDTTLKVNWQVDLDRETYEVGYMDNSDPTAPNVVTELKLGDDQQGNVFKGKGTVNVYWNIFSRKPFTLSLNVASPLATLSEDPTKLGANDDKINWQVSFRSKEVARTGQVVDADAVDTTIGSVATDNYSEGYGVPKTVFTQISGIDSGDKRKSAYTTLKIETQDIGDGSKIKGNYAGTLTLTVASAE